MAVDFLKEEKEDHVNKPGASIHRKLFQLAGNENGFFPGLTLFSFITAVVVIIQMYLLSTIISTVFIQSSYPSGITIWLLIISTVSRALLIWLREWFARGKAVHIKSNLRRKLFRHTLRLGPSYTRTEKTGEMIVTLSDGVEKLEDYYTRYIPSVVHILVLTPVIVLFTLWFDWISGLILLVTAPLIIFFMWLIGTYAKKLTRDQWKSMSRMSTHFLDVLQGLKTLKVFGRNEQEAENVISSSNSFRLITMKVLTVAFMSGLVLELAASISIALVAVQVGIRLIEGMMVFQTGLFVLLLAPEFYVPFRMLGQHHHSGMEGAAAAEKIFELEETMPQFIHVKETQAIPGESPTIEFLNVGFSYPGSTYPVLQGTSCLLQPGALTAIVGQTGSGKTTFAYLLLGYLSPSSGDILVNGTSLKGINLDLWHKQVAYVPQHPHFFNATVLDNLRMAKPEADMGNVVNAAKDSGAHSFIQSLPEGYNTMLTENASRLSGGERQRLAIARAFLKDAPVLVLDEPTSNLDPESEQLITEATQILVRNRTTLIIAHRLRTVRGADKILVISEGKISESGTHSELIMKKGVYAGYLDALGYKIRKSL